MNLSGLFRSTALTFIKKRHEKDDVYSLFFKPAHPLRHKAGQHGLFTIPGVKGFRPFSLASSPEEAFVMIGTHLREESGFKQALKSLKPGDTIKMRGPIFNYVLHKDTHQIVLLAQGIGITPFRSMLLHISTAHLPITSTLIHVDSADHTYRSETEQLATRALYPTNPDEFTALVEKVVQEEPLAAYYVSGGPGYITSIIKTLTNLGIARSRIKKDGFRGY